VIPMELLRDSLDEDLDNRWQQGRVARLCACALDRISFPEWEANIERAERWADGGKQARNSRASKLPCMEPAARGALLNASCFVPFRASWAVLADILGPLALPHLGEEWRRWELGTATALAEQIYQEKAWELCPVLADALDDAGVIDPELLGHLRAGLPHYRGCWAIDYLTGRMTGPRRRALRRLPRLNRPVKYQLLFTASGALAHLLLSTWGGAGASG
jgi:hypothetical protein